MAGMFQPGGGGGTTSPLTTKGDTWGYTTTDARFAVGSDYQSIVADSNQTIGQRWATNYKGVKNYIQYPDFENNATTGWTLGTVGTLTNGIPTGAPTFGSGASGNLSITTVSSGQIGGAYSLSFVSSAATTQGNMLATASLAIDTADQAKVLTWRFNYSVFSGASSGNFSGTSSNSFGVAVYDVTNSVWLSSTANFGMTQSTGVGYATGTCQTGSATANLRFVIYNANATSGAITLYFDDFIIGPQTSPVGMPITDWVAYTPTTVGLGTPSLVTFYSRRVGGNLEVTGTLTSGTATAATITISLGFQGGNNNVTVDTSRAPGLSVCGQVGIAAASTTFFGLSILVPSANQTYVNLATQTSTVGSTVVITGASYGSSILGTFHFSVPIVGWSSQTTLSSDTDTRVVAARANNASATVTGSYSNVTWGTVVSDTHGGMGSINYTVPVTGYYDIYSQVTLAGTQALNGTAAIQVLKNGSIVQENDTGYAGALTANNSIPIGINAISCNAGDTISIQVKSSATLPVIADGTNGCYVSIARRSGPSVIAATESVNMSYNTSSTAVTASLATITYSNKVRDSHNQYASGSYTIPTTGTYLATAGIAVSGTMALNTTLDLQIQQTGSATTISEQKVYAGGVQTALCADTQELFYCLAGDIIKVQVSTSATGSPAIVSSASQNYFSIARVGN